MTHRHSRTLALRPNRFFWVTRTSARRCRGPLSPQQHFFFCFQLLLFCYLVQTVKKKKISRRQSRGGQRPGSRETDFTGPVSRFPGSLSHCLCLWIWQLLQAVVVAKSWKGALVGSGKWRKTVCMSWRGEFRFLKRGQCELWIRFTIITPQCGVF